MPHLTTLALATTLLAIAPAQTTVPVRTVAPLASTIPGVIRGNTQVRALSDGRVIVNDLARRRIILFDSSLKSFTTLADTAAGAPSNYSDRVGLLPYLGDSSIIVDAVANALIIIEPSGKLGRVMAPPTRQLAGGLSAPACNCGFDPQGRVLYSTRRAPEYAPVVPPPADGANKPVITQIYADSGIIFRADFGTRQVDTIAMLKMPTLKTGMVSVQRNGLQGFSVFNPLPTTDEWTLLPDGTVAIVRAQDYHIDWIDARGVRSSSPKIPFAWKRISPEEKVALLDSSRKTAAERAARNPPPPGMLTPPFITVEPDEIADYYPPVRQGQVKADREGNVWILPSTALGADGGLVYDVVDRAGSLVTRVKLPAGRNVVAFGRDGIVYMIYAPTPEQIVLERGRVAR